MKEIRERLLLERPLIIRLLIASMLTYMLIDILFPGKADMTGTLTALLVVQASVMSTLKTSLERILAVLFGVGIAILFASWMGVNIFSLFIAVTISLVLGTILDFKDNKLEIPISAMLILAASQHGVASEQRVLNTLIGVGVGMTIAFLFPIKPKLKEAIKEVNQLAFTAAHNIEDIAHTVEEDPEYFNNHMESIKTVSIISDSTKAREAVKVARSSLMLNFGKFNERKYKIDLMNSINALENCITLLQKIIVSLELQVHDSKIHGSEFNEDFRNIYAGVMLDASYAVKTFGKIIEGDGVDTDGEFYHAIRRLRGSQSLLMEMTTIPKLPDTSLLIVGNILDSISGILLELDINTISEFEVKTSVIVKNYIGNIREPITRSNIRKNLARNERLRKTYRKIKYREQSPNGSKIK